MAPTIRLALVLSLLLPAAASAAEPPPNPMPAVHADRWADADAAAAQYADPVARKVVTYYRLLSPGAATAQEIAAFVATSPDWPAQALLERRRQDAIAADPDDAAVLAQCDQGTVAGQTTGSITTPGTIPTALLPATRLRCAGALANAGRNAEAAAEARRAWVAGFPDPAGFPQRWQPSMTPADQWDRFQILVRSDPAAAAHQITLLDPPHRALATARLALQRDDPTAAAQLAAVPPALAGDPGLMLAQAGWLRRTDRIPDAVALWRTRGTAAQQEATPAERAAFWAERERLARRLLHDGNPAGAYALVDDPGPISPRQALDADFLAGFIALRMLHQPEAATRHFQALGAASPAAITQGRAWYWLGRAAVAQNPRAATGAKATGANAAGANANGANANGAKADGANADWAKAAAWTTTFYGQLATLALGEDATALAARVNALHDPEGTRDQAFGLTQREVVRAGALLVAWGEPRRAEAFLLRMDELAPDLPDRALTALLSQYLGQPQIAVAIARRMGRDGAMLPQTGWPVPVNPPQDVVDPAIVLGLIRQESSFDSATVSPAGARGLMQLMPGTAATVAHEIGTSVTPVALVFDPQQNMRLGTAYLRELLDHYRGALPLALAAYNAGPGRVDQWLSENGDPRVEPPAGSVGMPAGSIDMVDWIELIPFAETRDYVQRVLENVVIYRARRGEATPTLLAQWTR
jgi:soluble lytic murein transglycosylase